MKRFPRIERLPPYVFNITAELKMAARHRGEDIIDMSMGNPDGPTPAHIVEKLVEAASRPTTHGYSYSTSAKQKWRQKQKKTREKPNPLPLRGPSNGSTLARTTFAQFTGPKQPPK